MNGNLPACLAVTLAYEGGWSNNPADPGGATMEGVTLAEYRRHHPGATPIDLRNMTIEARNAIYQQDYWDKIGGDALALGLDLCAFDACVNSGPGAARRWLARAGSGATSARIRAFSSARLSFLQGLRTFRVFGRGWSTRVAGIEAKALRMALGTSPAANAAIAHAATTSQAKAVQTRRGGHTTVGGAAGTGAAAAQQHAVQLGHAAPWLALGALAIIIIAALIYWRASQHQARADSLAKA